MHHIIKWMFIIRPLIKVCGVLSLLVIKICQIMLGIIKLYGLDLIPLITNAFRTPFMCSYHRRVQPRYRWTLAWHNGTVKNSHDMPKSRLSCPTYKVVTLLCSDSTTSFCTASYTASFAASRLLSAQSFSPQILLATSVQYASIFTPSPVLCLCSSNAKGQDTYHQRQFCSLCPLPQTKFGAHVLLENVTDVSIFSSVRLKPCVVRSISRRC